VAKVKAGNLKVVGAVYSIDSGIINWMGSHPLQDQLLSKVAAKPSHKKGTPKKSAQ
jgi:hypothetical protein